MKIIPWPHPELRYFNACIDPCDVMQGPCCCGATHMEGEFAFVPLRWQGEEIFKMSLWRHGKVVNTALIRMVQ